MGVVAPGEKNHPKIQRYLKGPGEFYKGHPITCDLFYCCVRRF